MNTKILILASNPKGTSNLDLEREMRDSIEIVKRASDRDRFMIETRLAVRPQDLQPALLEVKPRIVHFCGHGEGQRGLVLETDLGQQHLVSTEALADLFQHFSNQIECILLNACYSQVQAEEIVKHINYVIGMRQPILDRSAIVFSEGFYGALGAGESIERAYKLGCNRIQLEFSEQLSRSRKFEPIAIEEEDNNQSIPQHLVPILFIKKDPTTIEQIEESLVMQTKPESKGNSISIGNYTTLEGDVVGGDKKIIIRDIVNGNQYNLATDKSKNNLYRDKEASINEDQ